jgi:hypothetical protein
MTVKTIPWKSLFFEEEVLLLPDLKIHENFNHKEEELETDSNSDRVLGINNLFRH